MPLVTANQFRLTPDIGGAISQGLNIGNQFQNMQKRKTQFSQQQQESKDKKQQEVSQERFKSVINAAVKAKNLPDDQSRVAFLQQRKAELESKGVDAGDTVEALSLFESGQPEKANALIDSVIKTAEQTGFLKPIKSQEQSAEGRSFENLIANFSKEDKIKARRRKAGLDPRAVGSAIQTIAASDTAPTIAAVEKTLAEAKETGKLTAQHKLKPVVESAVMSAVGQAKAEVDKLGEQRSNDKALGVYETAMGNLTKALDNTITGPFVGFTPAMTSNAQIADGAIAMMLPLMKDVFRGAGEGTFTEGDQKILTDLIPTRNDNAEARASKITMLDSMIRAKLKTAPVAKTQQSGLSEAEQAELQQLRAELGQ